MGTPYMIQSEVTNSRFQVGPTKHLLPPPHPAALCPILAGAFPVRAAVERS